MELAGRSMRLVRPVSNPQSRRPESDFAKQRYYFLCATNLNDVHRKQTDNHSRFRYDNVINMDLDMPEKTTQVS